MGFGNILKTLREERGITQQDLADFLKVGRPTVAGYETKNKQPDYDKLIQIADFFNVSIDYLLGRTSIRTVSSQEIKEHINDDEKIFEARLTAGMEEEYGKKPSPEFVEFAKLMRREILEDIKREKQDKSGE